MNSTRPSVGHSRGMPGETDWSDVEGSVVTDNAFPSCVSLLYVMASLRCLILSHDAFV